MSYTHLTKTEHIFIEEYFSIGLNGRQIAEKLKRSHEAIYRVIRQLKDEKKRFKFINNTRKTNKNVDVNRYNSPTMK